jgi:hypothetical protein
MNVDKMQSAIRNIPAAVRPFTIVIIAGDTGDDAGDRPSIDEFNIREVVDPTPQEFNEKELYGC